MWVAACLSNLPYAASGIVDSDPLATVASTGRIVWTYGMPIENDADEEPLFITRDAGADGGRSGRQLAATRPAGAVRANVDLPFARAPACTAYANSSGGSDNKLVSI